MRHSSRYIGSVLRVVIAAAAASSMVGCFSPVVDTECGVVDCSARCGDSGSCAHGGPDSGADAGGILDGGADAGRVDGGVDAGIVDAGSDGGGQPSCGTESCPDGCCWRGICVAPEIQSPAACGSGGRACEACDAGGLCMAGACVPPCGPSNCAGCCMNNVCVPGTDYRACGLGGGTCKCCRLNETCIFDGTCYGGFPPGPLDVGGRCRASYDCAQFLDCRMDPRNTNSGYCTKGCDGGLSCPVGSSCRTITNADGGLESLCLQECWRDSCCSGDYRCGQIGNTGSNVCWLAL